MKKWLILGVVIALFLGTGIAAAAGVLFTNEFKIRVKGSPVVVTQVVKPESELFPGEATTSVYAVKNNRGETSKVSYIITDTKSPLGYDVAEVRVYSGFTNPPQGPEIPESGILEIGSGKTLYLEIRCKIYATAPPDATVDVKVSIEDFTGTEPL